MKHILLFLPLLMGLSLQAETVTSSYGGTAKNKDKKIVYLETHTATFDKKDRVQTSKTEYKSSDGKIIGLLESDFSKSLTAPSYVYEDMRSGNRHGIRYDGESLILFNQDKGKEEETKVYKKGFFKDSYMIVGCQGLYYYLRQNYEEAKSRGKIAIKLLTPGNLDYFSFTMKFRSEEDGIASFDVSISSLFLKLFVPKLEIKYDTKNKKLVEYNGISNIPNEEGDYKVVNITY